MDQQKNSQSSHPEKNNIPFEIPVNGSLGVLALGAVGIKAWKELRKKEAEEQAKLKDAKNDE